MKQLLTLLLLNLSLSITATDLILTGKVIAGQSQHFVTPWTSSWNIQLKWMPDEGVVVKKGDLVVVYDTANLESEIEQQEAVLRSSKEQAKEKRLNLEQLVIDAEHWVTQSKLRNELAVLEAGIPVKFRSEYEHESAQFDLTKTSKLLELSKINLISKNEELNAETNKQKIEIRRIENTLLKKQQDLSKLHLYAEQDGPVLHAMHPWHGTKITAGQIVKTRWRVASIGGTSGTKVRAWVNEVDWPQISKNQKVLLAADAYPSVSFKGTISKISQQAEEKHDWGDASYYGLDISIDEYPNIRLIPGMSMQVRVMSVNKSLIASRDEK